MNAKQTEAQHFGDENLAIDVGSILSSMDKIYPKAQSDEMHARQWLTMNEEEKNMNEINRKMYQENRAKKNEVQTNDDEKTYVFTRK